MQPGRLPDTASVWWLSLIHIFDYRSSCLDNCFYYTCQIFIVRTTGIFRIERGMRPFEAGIEGAKEIFLAVISTTITLVAVFLTIVFMERTSGRLFREFSFVVGGGLAPLARAPALHAGGQRFESVILHS